MGAIYTVGIKMGAWRIWKNSCNVPCGTILCLGPKFYKPPHPFCIHGGGGYSTSQPPVRIGWLGYSPTIAHTLNKIKMKIVAYQIIGATCKFVCQSGSLVKLVTTDNASGMIDFLLASDAMEYDSSKNMEELVKEHNERVKSFDMFEVLNKIW